MHQHLLCTSSCRSGTRSTQQTDSAAQWRCAGESGALSAQAATCCPNIPVLLIGSRLATEQLQCDADGSSDSSDGEGGGGPGRMHGDTREVTVHMAMVDGCVCCHHFHACITFMHA